MDRPLTPADHLYTDTPRETFSAALPVLWQRFGDAFGDEPPRLPEPTSLLVPGLGEVKAGDFLEHRFYGRCRVRAVAMADSGIAELEFTDKSRTMRVSTSFFRCSG